MVYVLEKISETEPFSLDKQKPKTRATLRRKKLKMSQPIKEDPHVDPKLVKRALKVLEEDVVAHWKEKKRSYRNNLTMSTGQIVQALGLGGTYDTKSKNYREVFAAMRHLLSLGEVSRVYGSTPSRWLYQGHVLDRLIEVFKKRQSDEVEKVKALVKRLRLKGVHVSKERDGGVNVEMSATEFFKLCKKVKVE